MNESARCPAYSHQHPKKWIGLETRTRTLGTLNFALALRGTSCGWGTCESPRRWFLGYHGINRSEGQYFARLVMREGAQDETTWKREVKFK